MGDRRRFQSAHFLLVAPPVAEVSSLLREMESAYRSVRSHGLDLPSRIGADAYESSGEFRRRTGVGSIYLAATIGERIHLQPPAVLLRNSGLLGALRHELVHVAFARASRNGLPRWVGEGMAMKVAGENRGDSATVRDLAGLERCLAGGGGGHRAVRACYAVARRLVDRLAGEIGERKLLELIERVASGRSFAAEFNQARGMTLEEWGRTQFR